MMNDAVRCPLCDQALQHRALRFIPSDPNARRKWIDPHEIVAVHANDKCLCIYLRDGTEVWEYYSACTLRWFTITYPWMTMVHRSWVVPAYFLGDVVNMPSTGDAHIIVPGLKMEIPISRRFRTSVRQEVNASLRNQMGQQNAAARTTPRPRRNQTSGARP